ncbi:MAG: pilus assembly protein [Rhizobiales bacterium]|nr:pilus assembly protein [Hyphomicrobiales bacterium]MBI3673685.1 pilus assembly protein [Hyphomicrobiales bacterium]
MIGKLARYLHDARGVAAIEMAFIMPFLLFLYFGLVDLTALISLNRKVTYGASVVADLVTQNDTTVTSASIDDYFNAVSLVMAPTPIANVRIEVYQFRKVNGSVTNQWSKLSANGPSCGVPSTSGLQNLMTDNNDIIIGEVCTTYSPYIASFLGQTILGATSFTMNEQIALRPRQSSTLNCTGC